MIPQHTLAVISLGGVVLDVMGGLYLAYDLLGGKWGPLRLITRSVAYALLFGLGYGLPLGPIYGLVAGAGLGLARGLEFRVAASSRDAGSRSPRRSGLPPSAAGSRRGSPQPSRAMPGSAQCLVSSASSASRPRTFAASPRRRSMSLGRVPG